MPLKSTLPNNICHNCGTPFHVPPSQLAIRVNCSQSCYDDWRHNRPDIDRFWERVEKTDGCWNWIGFVSRYGYGVFTIRFDRWLAHRWLAEQIHGPIPRNIDVCHHCDNRRCVRPEHLFLGTRQDNLTDMVLKGRSNKGILKHNAKLTEADVLAIREASRSGKTQQAIANTYGIAQSQVARIVLRRQWTHI